jgi:hypothetical protein
MTIGDPQIGSPRLQLMARFPPPTTGDARSLRACLLALAVLACPGPGAAHPAAVGGAAAADGNLGTGGADLGEAMQVGVGILASPGGDSTTMTLTGLNEHLLTAPGLCSAFMRAGECRGSPFVKEHCVDQCKTSKPLCACKPSVVTKWTKARAADDRVAKSLACWLFKKEIAELKAAATAMKREIAELKADKAELKAAAQSRSEQRLEPGIFFWKEANLTTRPI